MTRNRNVRRAFTLVEILIVVVILGILAAIVIPQFTNASEEASASSTTTQLQTVRSQIELYRIKNMAPPDLVINQWGDMLNPPGGERQYLQAAPLNPFTGFAVIVAGTSHLNGVSATDGWVWDAAAEQLYAVGFDESTGVYTAQ